MTRKTNRLVFIAVLVLILVFAFPAQFRDIFATFIPTHLGAQPGTGSLVNPYYYGGAELGFECEGAPELLLVKTNFGISGSGDMGEGRAVYYYNSGDLLDAYSTGKSSNVHLDSVIYDLPGAYKIIIGRKFDTNVKMSYIVWPNEKSATKYSGRPLTSSGSRLSRIPSNDPNTEMIQGGFDKKFKFVCENGAIREKVCSGFPEEFGTKDPNIICSQPPVHRASLSINSHC